MKRFIIINRSLITIMNLTGLVIMLGTLILVFFYPEVAGEILARLVNSIREGLNSTNN